MFSAKVYERRRKILKKRMKSGLVLFLGNEESPINYPDNPYPFRQDSSFLYFFGLDSPGLAAIVDVDEDKDVLLGDDVGVEDIIWMGDKPRMKDRAARVGVRETAPLHKLEERLKAAVQKGQRIHFLPPYRPNTVLKIARLLGLDPSMIRDYASKDLIRAVVEQREVKTQEEVSQMELAHEVTYEMYLAAMRMTKPGVYERELVGCMEGIALANGCAMAFPTILTINGQILHNHFHGHRLKKGRLVVADAGAESPLRYAADITRTFPVDGRLTQKQKDIYGIVLKAQKTAIRAIRPGVRFKSIHLKAARIICSGLKDIGLMKGDVNEGVKAGAHALFFPHGLGHMIGLDVHDMEDLGEKYVGYDEKIRRSEQFGLAYLRMAKELRTGYVMTVEPGIYFIPALIDKWTAEKKHRRFINYKEVENFRNFGGVRIEDNILVTERGHRVLGKSIPKTVDELEAVVGTG